MGSYNECCFCAYYGDSMGKKHIIKKFFILVAAILLSTDIQASFCQIDGNDVAKEANKIIGTRYVWGGNSNKHGLDCSALVKNIYSKYGYIIPRKASWQIKNTRSCPTYTDINDIRVGDAIYFSNRKKGIHHTAIVTGFSKDGTPIITHAKGKKFGVVREKMSKRYIREFIGGKRFYNCTSSLAGVYTEEEIAEAIILYAEKTGVKPKSLYDKIWEESGLNPLLISIAKDKNKEFDIDKLVAFREKGVRAYFHEDILKIEPKSIKEAKLIISTLYDFGFNFNVGLLQVNAKKVKRKEALGLIYPTKNLEIASRIK